MCLYSYQAYFTLSQKSEKPVTERNKILNLWSLFINSGNQFLIPADWIIERLVPDSMCSSWIFLSEGLGHFLQPNVLPKVSKTTDLPKVSKNEQAGSILTCPKSEMTINFELLKVRKMTSLKIYLSPVMDKLKYQTWTAGKPHSKGSIGYSTSGGNDIVT